MNANLTAEMISTSKLAWESPYGLVQGREHLFADKAGYTLAVHGSDGTGWKWEVYASIYRSRSRLHHGSAATEGEAKAQAVAAWTELLRPLARAANR